MTDATAAAPKPKPPIRLRFVPQSFPAMITTREKHDNRHWLVNSKDDVLNVLRTIYNERDSEGYYYDEKDKQTIAKAFKDATAFAEKQPERLAPEDVELYALGQFLDGRSGYQYEAVDLDYFSRVQEPPKPVHVVFERDIIFLGK